MIEILHLVIEGHPVVLKNSKDIAINKATGARFIKSNLRVEAYQHDALAQIMRQKPNGFKPIAIPIVLRCLFYGAWKSGAGNIPDLSNLYQMPEDLLEAAGIIENDNLIEAHDGSRRIMMCDSCDIRPRYKAGPKKGQLKADCGHVKRCRMERIEIDIYPLSQLSPSAKGSDKPRRAERDQVTLREALGGLLRNMR